MSIKSQDGDKTYVFECEVTARATVHVLVDGQSPEDALRQLKSMGAEHFDWEEEKDEFLDTADWDTDIEDEDDPAEVHAPVPKVGGK